MASLQHFRVPYTVSTMRISGHSIFKRLPQGNKAGETYKKLVISWISRTWEQVKYIWFHDQQESIVWSLEIMFTWENILKVLTTYY